jgi:hypothetical protein
MKKTIYLPVIRYRDSDGKPTCVADLHSFSSGKSWRQRGIAFLVKKGKACPFLLSSHFGTKYHCFWDQPNPTPPHPPQIFTRGDDGRGSLIPIDACPLWKGEER